MNTERIDEVMALVRAELINACEKHRSMHSGHEGYAVIQEEVEELWQRVKCNQGSDEYARAEAIQIAAMGARYVLDIARVSEPCGAWGRKAL